MRALLLAALVASIAVTLALTGVAPRNAYACSLAPPDKNDPLKYVLEDASLVIVGRVVDERATGGVSGEKAYESRVTPDAVLRGSAPNGDIVLPRLNTLGADCSGGPRLPEGERVLLFLYKTSMFDPQTGRNQQDVWQIGLVGGKVVIESGAAYVEVFDQRIRLGETEPAIRDIASRVGASQAQADAAVAAATGAAPVSAEDEDGRLIDSTWLYIGAAVLIIVVALAGGAFSHMLRDSSRQ